VLDGRGQRRDVVRDTVDELQERWVDDLVDHEDLIERIPGRDDVFGMIAYIVDPLRHIARHADPGKPTPTERRQADGKAGLQLANYVYHRLLSERAGWYDLARENGLTWTDIGAAVGKSRSGAYKERRALAYQLNSGSHHGSRDEGASTVPVYWKDVASDVQRYIATFSEYAAHFAEDESITDWLDLLALAGSRPGRQQFTFFLEMVEELTEATDCAGCERERAAGDGEPRQKPLLPIATADTGERLCIRCHPDGDPALASLLSSAADMRRTLIERRRAFNTYADAR
jgi:hypothetical protein